MSGSNISRERPGDEEGHEIPRKKLNIEDSKSQLRELGMRGDINDTPSLVVAFNDSKLDSDERELLRQWLEKYVDLFTNGKVTKKHEFHEYSLLADVECLEDEDRELIKNVFLSLCRRIGNDSYCPEAVVCALDYALSAISIDVLGAISAELITLANDLLDKILPSAVTYTKASYEKHGMNLFVIDQIITKLREMGQIGHLTENIFNEFKNKLDDIEKCVKYFPYLFHVKVMKKSLKELATGNFLAPVMRYGRCLFHFTCGSLLMIQGLAEIKSLSFDVMAIMEGTKRFKQGASEIESNKWYVDLTTLYEATRKTIETEDFTHFGACYNKLKSTRSWPFLKTGRKIVRYGLVLQLRLLVAQGPSDEIRGSAGEELLRLGVLPGGDDWVKDPDIFELLLESLQDVYREKIHEQRVPAVLIELEQKRLNEPAYLELKEKFAQWKGQRTIEKKLQSICKTTNVSCDQLFLKTRQAMGMTMTKDDIVAHVETLKNYYRSPRFAEVSFSI